MMNNGEASTSPRRVFITTRTHSGSHTLLRGCATKPIPVFLEVSLAVPDTAAQLEPGDDWKVVFSLAETALLP
jgi:AMMECR1 domain-containing protein